MVAVGGLEDAALGPEGREGVAEGGHAQAAEGAKLAQAERPGGVRERVFDAVQGADPRMPSGTATAWVSDPPSARRHYGAAKSRSGRPLLNWKSPNRVTARFSVSSALPYETRLVWIVNGPTGL